MTQSILLRASRTLILRLLAQGKADSPLALGEVTDSAGGLLGGCYAGFSWLPLKKKMENGASLPPTVA